MGERGQPGGSRAGRDSPQASEEDRATERLRKVRRFVVRYLTSLVGSVYAHTVGVGSSRARVFIGMSARYWRPPRSPFPVIDPVDIVPNDACVELVSLPPRGANVTGDELAFLCWLAVTISARNVFEIGTFDGRTTRNLARAIGASGRVTTVDLPPDKLASTALPMDRSESVYVGLVQTGLRFLNTPEAARIKVVLDDSARYRPRPEEEGAYELVFVDGAHSYAYVRSDTRLAMRLVNRQRGLIVWHDATLPDVERALMELQQQLPTIRIECVSGTTLALAAFVAGASVPLGEMLRCLAVSRLAQLSSTGQAPPLNG